MHDPDVQNDRMVDLGGDRTLHVYMGKSYYVYVYQSFLLCSSWESQTQVLTWTDNLMALNLLLNRNKHGLCKNTLIRMKLNFDENWVKMGGHLTILSNTYVYAYSD